MKRRILPLILAGVLLLCTLPQAGSAAEAEHLTPTRTYQGQFTDIQPSNWYYKNITALYELGLTNGKGDESHFAPAAEVSVGEALAIAARLRSLYEYGDSEKGPAEYTNTNSPWYASYTAYLQSMDCIGEEFDGLYEQSATRAQVAHILANALPSSLFTPINDKAVTVGYASRRYIQDVDEYTPYQQDILTLYRWGILSGMDEKGSFLPDDTIQRCQVAAMVTRLVYDDLRISLDWETSASYSKEGTTLKSLVSSTGRFHTAPSPNDSKAIDDNLRYPAGNGICPSITEKIPLPPQWRSSLWKLSLMVFAATPNKGIMKFAAHIPRVRALCPLPFPAVCMARIRLIITGKPPWTPPFWYTTGCGRKAVLLLLSQNTKRLRSISHGCAATAAMTTTAALIL